MSDKPFDLVGVGHIVHEMIYFPDRTIGPVLGSPPAYSLVAAARQEIRCGLVTKIGDDFPDNLLATFSDVQIDTNGIINCGRSTRSELTYDEKGNKEINLPTRADNIFARDIISAYHNCRLVYVCTMDDDVPVEELEATVALGEKSAIDLGGYGGVHMGKKRRSEIGDVPAFAKKAAGYFDFVKASDEDCRKIFGEAAINDYGKWLLTGKAEASLITLGSKGVLVTTSAGCWHVPPLKGKPIDATGGGDTFMGGFLSEYLRCGEVMQSAIFGSATALCVIEKTGGVSPERMPTETDARSRIPADAIDGVTLQK